MKWESVSEEFAAELRALAPSADMSMPGGAVLLESALRGGRERSVRNLLTAGADPFQEIRPGLTPHQLARDIMTWSDADWAPRRAAQALLRAAERAGPPRDSSK